MHVNTDILHPPDYFSLKKDTIASGLSKGAEDFISKMAGMILLLPAAILAAAQVGNPLRAHLLQRDQSDCCRIICPHLLS